jgi:hypothetical protein
MNGPKYGVARPVFGQDGRPVYLWGDKYFPAIGPFRHPGAPSTYPTLWAFPVSPQPRSVPGPWPSHNDQVVGNRAQTRPRASADNANARAQTGATSRSRPTDTPKRPKEKELAKVAQGHTDKDTRTLVHQILIASTNKRLGALPLHRIHADTPRESQVDVLECMQLSCEDLIREKQRELDIIRETLESTKQNKNKILRLPRGEHFWSSRAHCKAESRSLATEEQGKWEMYGWSLLPRLHFPRTKMEVY